MISHTRPFAGKYSRYVLSWLLLGLLGPLVIWSGEIVQTLISISAAIALTFGYDFVIRLVVKRKASALVKEKTELVMDAIRYGTDRKGHIAITKNFLLFVPVTSKVRTILDTKNIVRHEFDGQILELTVRFPNKHRMFQYYVSSPEKIEAVLLEKSGKSLPYKYDKMKKNKSV